MTDPAPSSKSLIPGLALLTTAAVLIVIVLVNPDMPRWLRLTIGIVAILMVLALMAFAFRLFRQSMQGGRR